MITLAQPRPPAPPAPPPPPTPPSDNQIWGEAGAQAMPGIARMMQARNGSGISFDERQKRYLRPFFGNLVDQVVVVHNSQMAHEWKFGDKEINLTGIDAVGQAYCERIYIQTPYTPGKPEDLLLYAHELTHSDQCFRGQRDIRRFGYNYFYEYKKADKNYRNNSYEVEAYGKQDRFKEFLLRTFSEQVDKVKNRPCNYEASARSLYNTKHLFIEYGGGGPLIFNNTGTDTLKNYFYIVDLNCGAFQTTDRVQLAAKGTGEYFSLRPNGQLMADQLGYGNNETFTIVALENDAHTMPVRGNRASLLKLPNGRFLKVEADGKISSTPDRTLATLLLWR